MFRAKPSGFSWPCIQAWDLAADEFLPLRLVKGGVVLPPDFLAPVIGSSPFTPLVLYIRLTMTCRNLFLIVSSSKS